MAGQPSDVSLKFNADGSLKIIQVTDLHTAYINSSINKDFLRDLARKERPDLFVLTGDNLSSGPLNWRTCSLNRF